MKRIVIGISGASGAIYGIRMLEVLKKINDFETHLIISNAAAITIREETSLTVHEVEGMADVVYDISDVGAAIASGSFRTEGMVIAPCSIKSMSMIAYSMDANLLIRAADVSLKEKKKLVVMVRETPLHLGHLKTMSRLAEMGATIAPPMPAFYHRPKSLDDLVNHTVGRILDQFGVEGNLFKRWSGSPHQDTGTSELKAGINM